MFEKMDLPELIGSDKQISWAKTIRASFIANAKVAKKDITSVLKNETHATFYIDNRSDADFNFLESYELYLSVFNFDLPSLEGTSQQVEWAEILRNQMLCRLSASLRSGDLGNLLQIFSSKVDATYFIANKDADYKEMVALAFAFVEATKIEPMLPELVGPEANRSKANKKRYNALERDLKALHLGRLSCCKEDIVELHMSKNNMDDYKI